MQNNEYWKCLDLNNLEGEIWKDVPNYEGLYQVSNLGRVKSLERMVGKTQGRRYAWCGSCCKLFHVVSVIG